MLGFGFCWAPEGAHTEGQKWGETGWAPRGCTLGGAIPTEGRQGCKSAGPSNGRVDTRTVEWNGRKASPPRRAACFRPTLECLDGRNNPMGPLGGGPPILPIARNVGDRLGLGYPVLVGLGHDGKLLHGALAHQAVILH